MPDERYEFGRPEDRQVVLVDGVVLPRRRFLVRRETTPGEWEDLGWIEVALTRVKDPPVGHAPVGVGVTVSVNLGPPTAEG